MTCLYCNKSQWFCLVLFRLKCRKESSCIISWYSPCLFWENQTFVTFFTFSISISFLQGQQYHPATENYTRLEQYDKTEFFDYLLNFTNYNPRMRPDQNSLVEVEKLEIINEFEVEVFLTYLVKPLFILNIWKSAEHWWIFMWRSVTACTSITLEMSTPLFRSSKFIFFLDKGERRKFHNYIYCILFIVWFVLVTIIGGKTWDFAI